MSAPGEPEVLRLQEVPTPRVGGPNHVLVRIKAAGVNPVDTKLRSRGTFYPERMPAILGCDGAGVVEACGAGVERFRPGDAVFFYHGGIGGAQGNYADYTVVDESFLVHKPESLSFVEAAAAPLVCITAAESLQDRARIGPDQQLLIHAGAGGVGHVAIQLARLAGARVCTTVGDERKAELVTRLGADLAILYRQADFVEATLQWTDGRGVDIALDTVGGATLNRSVELVRPYGDLVTILQPEGDFPWKEARLRNLRIGLELMLIPELRELSESQRHQTQILERCAELLGEGSLEIHVSRTFPLEAAAEAHRLVQQGSMLGKCVLVVEP
jgi:NADPH2:quinone reductase